jgi:hypothetical protein
MNRFSTASAFVLVSSAFGLAAVAPACGGSSGSKFNANGSSGSGSGGSSGAPSLTGSSGGSGGSGSGGTPPACPPGLQCNVSCPSGGTTTVTGKVYDPAGKNPLYNVAVYVPAVPLVPLPKGVPTGADACNCGVLFESGAMTNTSTGVDGSFTLTNVPVGTSVPLVLQVGKWRRAINIKVNSCATNALPDKTLTLPGTVAAGSDDSMPDIAVSTGNADTLECLMLRMGLPASEYVAGPGGAGHVHVFAGGLGNGQSESNQMPNEPDSTTALWANQGQLMPFDILLLSCEGAETNDANPPALEAYLNAGGRAFASHYHYSWFSGAFDNTQNYKAPADWGNHLAAWTPGGGNDTGPIGGVIDQQLNGSSTPFSKGQALAQWLGIVGALGQDGVPATELSIYQPRFNAVVGPANTPSQPWITSDANASTAHSTMYFSFDTPVNTPAGGTYCGRAVFSDLHVAGNPAVNDTGNSGGGKKGGGGSPPPAGCDDVDLSPQEKALEFMLFDLSSCVVPDTLPPPTGIPIPPK